MSEYMSDLALSNAIFEDQAIVAGRITVRMVMDACMSVPKLKGRLNFDDIRQLHTALETARVTLPYHMRVLLDAELAKPQAPKAEG